MTPFLAATGGARRRHLLFASMAGLVLLAVSLAAFELVVLKRLPFDNKSELKVVVDLPEGRTLEDNGALPTALAEYPDQGPGAVNVQVSCGPVRPTDRKNAG